MVCPLELFVISFFKYDTSEISIICPHTHSVPIFPFSNSSIDGMWYSSLSVLQILVRNRIRLGYRAINLERNPSCHIDKYCIILSWCASLEQLFNLSVSISSIYSYWSLNQRYFKHMNQIIIHIYTHISEAVLHWNHSLQIIFVYIC